MQSSTVQRPEAQGWQDNGTKDISVLVPGLWTWHLLWQKIKDPGMGMTLDIPRGKGREAGGSKS